jgi:hypothetical protein
MKPVYLMTKEECIEEVSSSNESNARIQQICLHFYKITNELISKYC